ncbi:hypothetical protein CDIK_0815 [Cucumispora dikerogammari]|nr:hypothetical protein CDIK_0815 [Cucumispora dikerogammari]
MKTVVETPTLTIIKNNIDTFRIKAKEHIYIIYPNTVFSINLLFKDIDLRKEVFSFELRGTYKYLTETYKLYTSPVIIYSDLLINNNLNNGANVIQKAESTSSDKLTSTEQRDYNLSSSVYNTGTAKDSASFDLSAETALSSTFPSSLSDDSISDVLNDKSPAVVLNEDTDPFTLNNKTNLDALGDKSSLVKLKINLPSNIPPTIFCLNISVEYHFIITHIKYKTKFILKEPFMIRNNNKCDTIRADKVLKKECIQAVGVNKDLKREENEVTWLIDLLRGNCLQNSVSQNNIVKIEGLNNNNLCIIMKKFFMKQKEFIGKRTNCIYLVNLFSNTDELSNLLYNNPSRSNKNINKKQSKTILDNITGSVALADKSNYVELITAINHNGKVLAYDNKCASTKSIRLTSILGNIEIHYSNKLLLKNKISITYNYNVKHTKIQFIKIEKSWQEEMKDVLEELEFYSDRMIYKNLEFVCKNIDRFSNSELEIKYGVRFVFDEMEKTIVYYE